ncbi:MAG: NUDIX domain-containing protein [Clostridia bacterium]|nr:NUDIX domain-containing protein [Clostridia bacterium]
MSIRCAAKAIIIRDGCVLLNRCTHTDGRIYYDLPGGGQRQYETLEDAVRREVLEETGYAVNSLRFAALAEEIYTHPRMREAHPGYAHCIFHIFLAEIEEGQRSIPSEPDRFMLESVFIPIEDIPSLPETRPPSLKSSLSGIIAGQSPIFLGTAFLDWEEP